MNTPPISTVASETAKPKTPCGSLLSPMVTFMVEALTLITAPLVGDSRAIKNLSVDMTEGERETRKEMEKETVRETDRKRQ